MEFLISNETACQINDKKIIMEALSKSDRVNDCQSKQIVNNAVMLLVEMTGDFTIKAKLSHEFKSVYDAACLIIYENDELWAKACFECSPNHMHTAVTVMTNTYSDDCNHVTVEENYIWMRMNKHNDIISVQYSIDQEHWEFIRILSLPFANNVKVGFLAQSPQGDGGNFIFEDYSIEHKTFLDIRKGI